ncbi:MAG: hypothetical protein KC996_02390 [Phycisphaerales bacterium]|nr:hypothetical protein [Phycisphaerales bacterium]
MSVNTRPFNSHDRKLICIYCRYERSVEDPSTICPECGKTGLVPEHSLKRGEWLARTMLWINGAIAIGALSIGPIRWMTGFNVLGTLTPLIWLCGLGTSFTGIFVFGYGLDRPYLRKNHAVRRRTWLGMFFSVGLLIELFVLPFVLD